GKRCVEVWGTGKATRDFCYAGDVADGMIRMAEKIDEPVLLNMSCGAEASIHEVVEALTDITGFAGEVKWLANKPEGQARRLFDMSKTESTLGFRCRTPLVEGLRFTVDWYRENRAIARNLVATTF
ncbi:MAG TPA: NAD-dependent epimerase/dehydratase family protein, partial [Lacipirellulaceae bacterium]|nr:NAD-dependent epimerase/dehydratase family protein [Lacipirellulaceae bacterium]